MVVLRQSENAHHIISTMNAMTSALDVQLGVINLLREEPRGRPKKNARGKTILPDLFHEPAEVRAGSLRHHLLFASFWLIEANKNEGAYVHW